MHIIRMRLTHKHPMDKKFGYHCFTYRTSALQREVKFHRSAVEVPGGCLYSYSVWDRDTNIESMSFRGDCKWTLRETLDAVTKVRESLGVGSSPNET